MKTIFTTLFVLFLAQFSFAQIVATASVTPEDSMMKTTTTISVKKQERMAKRQNKSVSAQLKSFVQKELQYSEIMTENCMEGMAIIQVNISETGTITHKKVVKSPNAEMTTVLLKALENLEDFDFDGNVYYGHKKVRVPVDFSMR